MTKTKAKPLTDKEFLANLAPRLSRDGDVWRLNGILEAGHCHTFEDEAARFVSICNRSGGHAKIEKQVRWWQVYKTYNEARKDHFYNHTILSIRGPFARLLEALMSSSRH